MDWSLIFQHTISGYIILIPIVLLYFGILYFRGKKQTCEHIIFTFIFCGYLIGVLSLTGIWWIESFSPRIVLVPFVNMVSAPITNLLNVLLFVPLGIFLPLLYKNYNNTYKVALTALFISLSIEFFQMFGCGTTDIDDLITNIVGACLGYVIYRLVFNVIPESWRKRTLNSGIHYYYELMFCWIVSLLSMATLQLKIFEMIF